MNRRNFLASLAAIAVLDPEKLLWIPGQKKIFVPPAPVIVAPWGPILGINIEATRESGMFHNGLRTAADTINVLQYSDLDEVCRPAFDRWLQFWGYGVPSKENPNLDPEIQKAVYGGQLRRGAVVTCDEGFPYRPGAGAWLASDRYIIDGPSGNVAQE